MDYRDLAHRLVWTFIQAFTGALIASGALESVDLTVLEAAAIAGLGDVLVVIKEFARKQLGIRCAVGDRIGHR